MAAKGNLFLLYQSVVLSVIDYGQHTTMSQTHLLKLESLKKKGNASIDRETETETRKIDRYFTFYAQSTANGHYQGETNVGYCRHK